MKVCAFPTIILCVITKMPLILLSYVYYSNFRGALFEMYTNYAFRILVILVSILLGILLAREHQYTRRSNFLRQTDVSIKSVSLYTAFVAFIALSALGQYLSAVYNTILTCILA